jgi:hypothetical protein
MLELEIDAPWIYARRRRALIKAPTTAKRVWVEDSIGNWYFVKADFGNGRSKTVAEHIDVRDTVVELEAAGCVVENVPKWCREPDAPLPVTASYNDWGYHPSAVLLPMLACTSMGIFVIDWVMRHFFGHSLFSH